jgi:UDP-N-acetylmuramyl tripeptide synthase
MIQFRVWLALTIARLGVWVIKSANLGSGTTWPGHIALRIDPLFVLHVLEKSSCRVILVAGTNGKTTTASMIRTIIEKNTNERVIYNAEGANLISGVASVLIARQDDITSRPAWCVFECDENALRAVVTQTKPEVVVLLNLFRDQLDRYGEVNSIGAEWKDLFAAHKDVNYIVNADDPLLASLVNDCPRVDAYSAPQSMMKQRTLGHDVDSIYCPICRAALTYTHIAYSHIGNYHCSSCGFARPKHEDYGEFKGKKYPLMGLYNLYNTHAAILASTKVLGIAPRAAFEVLTTHFVPMFGRQEVLRYKDRQLTIMLSKNPAGFNQAVQALTEAANQHKTAVLILLNDQIPDGRDVSWIWDVELDDLMSLAEVCYGGERAYDIALRAAYTFEKVPEVLHENGEITCAGSHITTDIEVAIDQFVKRYSPSHTLYILATYSAMLAARRHIAGNSFHTQQS